MRVELSFYRGMVTSAVDRAGDFVTYEQTANRPLDIPEDPITDVIFGHSRGFNSESDPRIDQRSNN
jgi:hypothetical protein